MDERLIEFEKNSDFSIEEGILLGKYPENSHLDLETVKLAVKLRKEATNYQSMPMLIDTRHVKSITKEARHYLASKAGYELITSAAILSDSIISIYLANFLIRVHFQKTPVPVKLFTNKEKAMEWLRTYV